MPRNAFTAAVLLLVFALFTSTAFAQSGERRFFEEEQRKALDKASNLTAGDPFFGDPSPEDVAMPLGERKSFLLDYGTFSRFTVINFDEVGRDVTIRDTDFRVWFDLDIATGLKAFARGKMKLTDFNAGDAPDGNDDNVGDPAIDQMVLTWKPDVFEAGALTLNLGRQYVFLGRGMTLNEVQDGLFTTAEFGSFAVSAFVTKTPDDRSDIDQSRPNAKESDRLFYGAELTLYSLGFLPGQHRPRLFAFQMVDNNDEKPEIVPQDFEFDSFYVGMGWEGVVPWFGAGWTYESEFVYQTGERFAHAQTGTPENVSAWAFKIDLDWALKDMPELDPKITFSMFGASGDEDRDTALNTIFGNLAGTDDNAFVGFGYVFTGFALAPTYSNIMGMRVGSSMIPWRDERGWTQRIEVGADLFYLMKQEKDGAISDSQADRFESYVGSELDLYVNWDMQSDLSSSFKWGVFFPGDAYTAKEARNFFSMSVTLHFR